MCGVSHLDVIFVFARFFDEYFAAPVTAEIICFTIVLVGERKVCIKLYSAYRIYRHMVLYICFYL